MRTLLIICALLCAIPLIASQKKVVCYWNSFSVRNEGLKGMFAVKDIDPKICTHIIYTYIRFTASVSIFQDYNPEDIQAFTNLRGQNANVKLLIGIGGPRQGTQNPSTIASTPTNRNDFSQKVKNFIDTNGFDGCDFDWQWPGQGSGSSSNDKDNYVLLLQNLRNTLGTSRVFSVSVAPRQEDIDKSYDVLKIHQYVDFINLNTYNFHGFEGETVTAFHSPYRKLPNDQTPEGKWNAISVVENWLSKGVPSAKLTLGIPTYGRSFTLTDMQQTGVGAPVSGIGMQSEYSVEFTNVIPYVEICTSTQTNFRWNSFWNSAQFASYAVFNANQWVGYDDLQVVKTKIHLALNNDLGGLNYATIDRDDFYGNCTGTKFPLIKIGYDAMVNNIIPSNPAETTTTTTTSTTTTTTTTTNPPEISQTTTAVSKDPDTDDKSTTEPITEPITTTTELTTTESTRTEPTTSEPTTTEPSTTEVTTEPITITVEPTTLESTTVTATETGEPITTEPTTIEPSTTLPTTSTTSIKTSTVSRTTVTRTSTTRATTSSIPTPPVTPRNNNSTTTKTSENEQNSTSVMTTAEILSTITTEDMLSTQEETTTKKLSTTTSTRVPTPPVTPNANLRTTQSSSSVQTNVQESEITETAQESETTEIIQETTQSSPNTRTTTSRTTAYNIPTPPVTPGSSKSKRSAEFPIEKSFVCPEENGKFKNPEDCASYIVCVSYVPYKFYCNYGKYYDELNNHCDYQLKLKC